MQDHGQWQIAGRILLCGLIHGIHGRVDFLQPRRLLARRLDDSRDVLVDLSHLRDDLLQRLSGPANKVDAVLDHGARPADQVLDLLGGLRRTLGELTYFLGNDSKPLACFARPSGFDASIERKQVRLEGDIVNDADDTGNLS